MSSHRNHDRRPAELQIPVYVAPDRNVTIRLHTAISYRSVETIQMKIEDRKYIRSPDGGIFIDLEAVQRWLAEGR